MARDGSDAGGSDAPVPDLPLWFVTVTFAGEPVPDEELRAGLLRLTEERPFLASARYGQGRVEVRYWDEAENIDDAAALALRLWFEHRDSAGLPNWHVVALEVLDRSTVRERGDRGLAGPSLVLGEVRPL